MDKQCYIDLFVVLGERLESFGDSRTQSVITEAIAANAWFTEKEIALAVDSLRRGMLRRDILEKWLYGHDIQYGQPKHIALIMAGNIPLVGFADLMCVIATGNAAYVKASSKDTALIKYVTGLIKDIDAHAMVYDYRADAAYDAVIATGSNDTGKYFRTAFAGVPSIIRGSRSSVAILTGEESEDELRRLGDDIFSYSGMGCRNVSLIFAPEKYDLERFGCLVTPARSNINKKYYNNYLSVRAGLFASGQSFTDCGMFVLTEDDSFPVPLSNIVAFRYSDISEVNEWLNANDSVIQCVVGNGINHPRVTGFGRAQYPYIWDYPDGEDVVRFLNKLQEAD